MVKDLGPMPPDPEPSKTYNDGLEAAAKYIEWCASALTGTEPEYHALQETAKNIRALKELKQPERKTVR